MATDFLTDKMTEIQECWNRIKKIITLTTINSDSGNKLEKDITLMDDLLSNNNNNDTGNIDKRNISDITSKEFNNIMNEIDDDIKTNDTALDNNSKPESNEEYSKLSKIQKDFIAKPVMYSNNIFGCFYFRVFFICF